MVVAWVMKFSGEIGLRKNEMSKILTYGAIHEIHNVYVPQEFVRIQYI